MKKEEFLKELEQRLHILNEDERRDILGEYSQHIDMKMQTGMSEEIAAKDFGDIKVLADEILSAYNVNLQYNRRKLMENGRNKMDKLGIALGKRVKQCWNAFLHFLKRCYAGTAAGIDRAREALTGVIRRKNKSLKSSGEGGCDEMNDVNLEIQTAGLSGYKEENGEIPKRHPIGEICAKIARGMKHGICNIGHGTFLLGKLCLRGLMLLLSLPFIVASCGLLLCLGIVIVLIPQGYPLVGIGIILIGCFACTFSVAGVTLSCCIKKKRIAAETSDSTDVIETEGSTVEEVKKDLYIGDGEVHI